MEDFFATYFTNQRSTVAANFQDEVDAEARNFFGPTDGGPVVADGWNLNKKEIGRVILPKGLMVSCTSCDGKVEGVQVVFLIAFDWGF